MESEIIRLKGEGWGREKIAEYLGITVYQVRTVLAKCRYEGESKVERILQVPQENNKVIMSVEYKDGKTTYDAELELSEEELADERAVMLMCKLNPDKWDVVSYRYSAHDGMAKIKTSETGPEIMEIKKLYGVRLCVKPKAKGGFDLDRAIEQIAKLQPREIHPVPNFGNGMLELGITDAHFGPNTLEDYQETLSEIIDLMKDKEQVVVIMGSDNIDVNGFSYQTIHGTQLEPIDLNKAWDEAFVFFSTIIHYAIQHSIVVHVKFVPGNHDRDISWSMVKAMQKLYPQAIYDTSLEQYKALRYGNVAIGWTHGDEGKSKDYDRTFMRDFPEIFGGAEILEIHSGHLHREGVGDVTGVMVRTLPSKTKRNAWADKKGYRSVPRFQCFEYTKDRVKSIHYV